VSQNLLKGPHYQVAEEVRTDDYFHQFLIRSDYGEFPADGTDMLFIRLREVRALAALVDVSRTEVFLTSAGGSVLHVGENALGAVQDPVGTVQGVGAGVKRFAINVGRKASRAAESAKETATSEESTAGSAASAAGDGAAEALGVNAASRRWAQKLGVDPYSSNAALRKALSEIGRIDSAGSIAVKVAVPIPAPVGMASSVSDLVWSTGPEELLKQNEKQLAEMGVSKASSARFFKNKSFSPTLATTFVTSLHSVPAKGLTEYVETAAGAQAERDARFYAESAVMLQRFHAESPVDAVLADSKVIVARTRGGRTIALLPIDWMPWTPESAKAVADIGARAKKDLGATSLELQLTGRLSAEARRQIDALGWKATERVPAVVPPPEPETTGDLLMPRGDVGVAFGCAATCSTLSKVRCDV
jgi:hypothetical protein